MSNNEITSTCIETMSVSSDLSTNSSDSDRKCRICRSSRNQEDLVSPCYCKGSIRDVHLQCLEAFLAVKEGRDVCEVCEYEYKTERISKYGAMESFLMFKSDPSNEKSVRRIMSVIFIFTTLFAIDTCLCILQHVNPSWNPFQQIMSHHFSNNFTIPCTFYFIFMWTSMNYLYENWKIWRKSTITVRVLNIPG